MLFNRIDTKELNAGVDTLVYEDTLTSAATSVTISGLTGNTDMVYYLKVFLVSNYAGTLTVSVRPNNDSGTNYGWQYMRGTSTTASAARSTDTGFDMGFTLTAAGYLAYSDMIIYAKSGNERVAVVSDASSITGTTVGYAEMFGQSWSNTADEITSLVIVASQTSGLGVGTKIALYKRGGTA